MHLLYPYYGTQNVYACEGNQKQLRYDVRNSVFFAHQKLGKDKSSIKQEEQGIQMIYNVTADFFLMENPERNILNTYQNYGNRNNNYNNSQNI